MNRDYRPPLEEWIGADSEPAVRQRIREPESPPTWKFLGICLGLVAFAAVAGVSQCSVYPAIDAAIIKPLAGEAIE